ncbi:hypothetical protein GCM10008944_18320 [Cytobacillus oceanisediminis]
MPRTPVIPAELRRGPFHIDDAERAGVSHHRLRGANYRRLYPRVWVHTGHVMTEACWWRAALLHAPDDAMFTGATGLQRLGLDLGPHLPIQMVVPRDLHRDVDDIVFHRTECLPDNEDRTVCPEAVFAEICRWFSLPEAVAAGDWLLAQEHMTIRSLHRFCERDDWRAGAWEARQVSRLLDARSRSIPESKTRVHFWAAGLPAPEVNAPVLVDGRAVALADWLWRLFRLAAEYEGGHHQSDRSQYLKDLDRYRIFRRIDLDYVQVTAEHSPTSAVLAVYRRLIANGYAGPPPNFGPGFQGLTEPVPLTLPRFGLGAPDPTGRYAPLFTAGPATVGTSKHAASRPVER